MSKVHNMFEVSQLNKCFHKEEEARKTSLNAIEVQDYLTYEEYPIKILDDQLRITRRNVIKFGKVQWSNHTKEEAAWECEDTLPEEFPIYSPMSNLRINIYFKGDKVITSQFFIVEFFFKARACARASSTFLSEIVMAIISLNTSFDDILRYPNLCLMGFILIFSNVKIA
jgi:hypothetical protein